VTRRASAIQAALAVLFVAAWIAVTDLHLINPLFLPRPLAVWGAMLRLVRSGALWSAAAVTTLTVAEAYALAVVAGIAAGFFIGRSRRLTLAYEPLLSGIFAIPIVLFFPLFTVFFGIGPASKVAFGATIAFFPIALNTIAGFGGVDPLLLRSARSLGASRWQTFRHVYLPGALPVVVTGMRIGFFLCFASVLGGETLSSAAGVGYSIAHSAELLEGAQMYAWIVFVLATTAILNLAVSALESRAQRG
jgi:ABC-type nitrate/sulfonate/bicarbonate transport system permease component